MTKKLPIRSVTIPLTVRVTPAQADEIQAAAERKGVPVASFIRMAALDMARQ